MSRNSGARPTPEVPWGIGKRCATYRELNRWNLGQPEHDILSVMPLRRSVLIHLVGPGGAGKSTVGLALATRLGIAFIDLDVQFKARAGDITVYLHANGYDAYAERSVRVYLQARAGLQESAVIALSSGFMTYDPDVHPAYVELRAQIARDPMTFVLLPSLDYEACVRETVRRQMSRPFSRSAEREEEVIRQRFGQYHQLPAKKVETLQPVDAVVDGLLGHVGPMID